MRSFTDDSGLKNFSFNRMSARTLAAAVIFDSRQGRVADSLVLVAASVLISN